MFDELVDLPTPCQAVHTGGRHLWKILVALLTGGQSDTWQSLQQIEDYIENVDDTCNAYASARSQYNLEPATVINLVAEMEAKWPCQLVDMDCIVSNEHSLLQNMIFLQHGTVVGLNGVQVGTWTTVLHSVLLLNIPNSEWVGVLAAWAQCW